MIFIYFDFFPVPILTLPSPTPSLVSICSYVCDEYVLDDNAAGDLKILRQTLTAIRNQTLDEATTRSGKRILRAMSVDTGNIIKQR